MIVGTGFGRPGGIEPVLPPPSETDGAPSKEQKNERGESRPKSGCGIGREGRVT